MNPAASEDEKASKKRILFATIAAGNSHVSTAEALSEALETYFPDCFDLRISEIMVEFGFERFDSLHKATWRRALQHPWTVVWGQRLIDRFPQGTVSFHRWLLRDLAMRAANQLNADPPDLIVVNHGWLTVALTASQQQFGLKVPVLTYETSTVNANALWADVDAERFVVGSPLSKKRLVGFGVRPEKIDVVGYPVRQAFLHAPSKEAARAQLGLDNHFTCLITLGGEGMGGDPFIITRALQELTPRAQVVVITGRNRELRARLEALPEIPRLIVRGFVDDMASYIAASDVVIAKTGPATVFETLAVGRPIIAPMRSGGVENKLIEILERQHLGKYAPTLPELLAIIDHYRHDPAALAAVSRKAVALDFRGMAKRLARYIAHYAMTQEVDPRTHGAGLGTLVQ